MTKKLTAMFMATLMMSGLAFSDLILTAIYDGSSSSPKGVELYVTSTANFDGWTLDTQANAATTWTVGYTFDTTTYQAGSFIYVTSTASDPTIVGLASGTDVIISDGSFVGNGDDRVRLANPSAATVDIIGEDGVDGTGTAWEYTDSYGIRNAGTGPTSTFNVNEWTFAPINTLDPGNTPLETTLHTYNVVPEPATFSLLGIGGLLLWFRRRMK